MAPGAEGKQLDAALLDAVPTAARADESEAALLGAFLLSPEAIDECPDISADDFFRPEFQRVCAWLFAERDRVGDGEGWDAVVLRDGLAEAGALDGIGGAEGLVGLMDAASAKAALHLHAEKVYRAAVTRRFLDFHVGQIRKTYAPDFRPGDTLTTLESRIRRIVDGDGHAPAALAVRTASEIEPKSVSWVLPPYFPAGKLTNMIGNAGEGKTLLGLTTCKPITRGCGWPGDPAFRARPGTVLYASAEDDAADTLVPRALAAGVDLARLEIIEGVGNMNARRALDLGRHLDALRAHLAKTPDARLLILDPLAAFMVGPDSHKANEVRAALTPIAALAQETGVAVVGIHHLRKSPAKALHRGLGSVAYAAAARSVVGVGRDPANPTGPRRLLVPVKTNLIAAPPALAFSIRANGDGVPVVVWEPAPVQGVDADAVLGGFNDAAPGPDAEALSEAAEFVRGELVDGPRPQREIEQAAATIGIARRTLRRAKAALGVESRREGFGRQGAWVWLLPKTAEAASSNLATYEGMEAPAESGHL